MSAITLGILAGGAGSRVQGRDKALLRRDGITQLARIIEWGRAQALPMMLSSNRAAEDYAEFGLGPLADEAALRGAGPMAGLITLMRHTPSPVLITLPVDVAQWPLDWHQRLAQATHDDDVACALDDGGPQPLIAAWRVPTSLPMLERAAAQGQWSVQECQRRMQYRSVSFDGFRFGNLNHREDFDD